MHSLLDFKEELRKKNTGFPPELRRKYRFFAFDPAIQVPAK
jgi:hypothetical protein